MSTPYIPAKDADFANWSTNFSNVITANPSAYGLVAADATAIAAANSAFQTAYALALNPATRTSVTIANKDVQKASTLITERTYAQIIQNNAGVSDANKAAAGLTIRKTSRTPIPTPGTTPILGLIGGTPGVITLNFKDTTTPTSKAKPFGATLLEMYAQYPGTNTADIDLATFVGYNTKSPFAYDVPTGKKGLGVTFWGRWGTRTGKVGPFSNPLSTIAT